jgi:hypothetical protein
MGYPSDLLAQIPLRWMMKKASSQGLAFKNDIDLDGDALKADISDSYREFMYGGLLFSDSFFALSCATLATEITCLAAARRVRWEPRLAVGFGTNER